MANQIGHTLDGEVFMVFDSQHKGEDIQTAVTFTPEKALEVIRALQVSQLAAKKVIDERNSVNDN